MKLPNFFTALRIVLAPVFFLIYSIPLWTGFGSVPSVFILIPLFVFMEFTDFLDGYYARRLGLVSDFGKLFDPFGDVLANLTVLFAFVLSGYLPALLFLVILYREMGIMFVRMLASRQGVAIGARKGGKTKTVLYIVAAGISLAIESGVRLGILAQNHLTVFRWINIAFYGVAVIVSIISFIDYVVTFGAILRQNTISEKK